MPAPRVDYEAAWEELQELILAREGWGTKALITEMAALRVKHRVQPEDPASADGGMPTVPRAGHGITEDPKEDRDDRSDRPAAVAAAA